MNDTQKRLLNLASTKDLGGVTYYRIAKELKIDHPYKVKYALDQLLKRGLLIKDAQTLSITKPTQESIANKLVRIPYYGEVNCGEALTFADNQIKDYLKISLSVLSEKYTDDLFALKAVGSSMNRARINGKKAVRDGDYIIARRGNGGIPKNGEYVISVIWGVVNLKRFYKDDKNKRLLLVSESSEDLSPIIISDCDADDPGVYKAIATVIDVLPIAV